MDFVLDPVAREVLRRQNAPGHQIELQDEFEVLFLDFGQRTLAAIAACPVDQEIDPSELRDRLGQRFLNRRLSQKIHLYGVHPLARLAGLAQLADPDT